MIFEKGELNNIEVLAASAADGKWEWKGFTHKDFDRLRDYSRITCLSAFNVDYTVICTTTIDLISTSTNFWVSHMVTIMSHLSVFQIGTLKEQRILALKSVI